MAAPGVSSRASFIEARPPLLPVAALAQANAISGADAACGTTRTQPLRSLPALAPEPPRLPHTSTGTLRNRDVRCSVPTPCVSHALHALERHAVPGADRARGVPRPSPTDIATQRFASTDASLVPRIRGALTLVVRVGHAMSGPDGTCAVPRRCSWGRRESHSECEARRRPRLLAAQSEPGPGPAGQLLCSMAFLQCLATMLA
eukprot:3566483-Rhodomonas_salina.4